MVMSDNEHASETSARIDTLAYSDSMTIISSVVTEEKFLDYQEEVEHKFQDVNTAMQTLDECMKMVGQNEMSIDALRSAVPEGLYAIAYRMYKTDYEVSNTMTLMASHILIVRTVLYRIATTPLMKLLNHMFGWYILGHDGCIPQFATILR